MKLYHGSPNNLTVLKPQNAKGMNEFENITGVFLTDDFFHAALYAMGKTLKGKTVFGVSEKKLVILGNLEPKEGYVYEVEVENAIKGHRGQYGYEKELKPIKKTKVYPNDYKQYILRVKNKEELMESLKAKSE